jgi:uncharacterized protein
LPNPREAPSQSQFWLYSSQLIVHPVGDVTALECIHSIHSILSNFRICMPTNLNLYSMLSERLSISQDDIVAFCNRWQVTELALFGSVLREDFNPDSSDVDVLVSFAPEHAWTFDAAFQMREELMELFKRNVDLISRTSLEKSSNWLRKNNILNSAQVIYAC